MDSNRCREQWRQYIPIYLVFVLAFPLGMAWVETRALDGPSPCMFRQTTHLDCPSCGLTRAFRSMGRLDVASAFYYNPLGPAIFLGTMVYWGYALGMLLTRGRVPLPQWWTRWKARLFYAAFTIFMLVGIARIVYQLHHPPPPPKPLVSGRLWPSSWR